MKYIMLAFLTILSFSAASAQVRYHKAKISLEGKNIEDLAKLGVEVDHGHLAIGRFLENDFSEKEISKIKAAGFIVDITIHDVGNYYANQLSEDLLKVNGEDCFPDPQYNIYDTPTNFTLGTMGGFYTYQELLDILDDMQTKFPDLISVKKQIGTLTTHEGRPIYSVVISDNPSISEDEPKTLYTALHHAREPNSLTQLVFYMWHILENYGSDPQITTIVEELELHFIPVVNPDGYVYNQTTDPNGGGLWRKNRRDNLDGTFGVDLNRNYGFEWGIDDVGSSSETDSDVYRGPSAFSEPETQAVKLYCETHDFNFALNYHTYGNLLIYPWGYSDAPTPEHNYFQAIASEITELNEYKYGSSSETVGYGVNGTTDDWMYGELTKQKSYAMTPEVGTEGFWPLISQIVPNCKANVQANLSMASFNLNYPILSTDSPIFIDDFTGLITYSVGQLGLQPAMFTVSAEPISDNVTIFENTEYTLVNLEQQQKTLEFQIDPSIALGEEVVMVIKTNVPTPFSSDTIRFIYLENGTSQVVVEEVFGEDHFWVADGEAWFYDDAEFISPTVSFSDSKNSNYNSDENKLATSKSIFLPESEKILLTFDLKVEIEEGYDYAALYIVPEGEEPVILCGQYSTAGTEYQLENNPIYDGTFDWVKEFIDITEWQGNDVRFQLTFISDGFLSRDGLYLDDWSIRSVNNPVKANQFDVNNRIEIYPNPTSDQLKINLPYQDITSVWITNTIGQTVLAPQNNINTLDVTSLLDGFYYVVIMDSDGQIRRGSFIKE